MKKAAFLIASTVFMLPALANASGLTSMQASAIVGLLQAFGAEQAVILRVEQVLGLAAVASTPVLTDDPSPPIHAPIIGSVYKSSNLGFDYSYNAPLFPPAQFGFGIVGVTHGKSFTQNQRINQEFSWAQFGAGAPPTLYMNLNAPYGSAAAANVSTPKNCPTPFLANNEPTACAGYNYGYNAAKYAFAYAKSAGVSSPIWWMDIEEANSWSLDTSVNDATLQGAIDYINSQNTRVGVYSLMSMWSTIMGSSFVPTQTYNGQSTPIPTWLPIGTDTQLGAMNACVTTMSFMANSPVWIIQYEENSTATDQNVAC